MMHPLKDLPANERVIVPLDMDPSEVMSIVFACKRAGIDRFKVGHKLIKRIGLAAAVRMVEAWGGVVMADEKLIDIPNTMTGGTASIVSHGNTIEMFTVMAAAGVEGVAAAVQAAAGKAYVIGVTVLTSMSPEECQRIYGRSPLEQVAIFRDILLEAKADAVVCSPKELEVVRDSGLVCITPGVRPAWLSKEQKPGGKADDQKRVLSARDAIRAGAHLLVVGRPITDEEMRGGRTIEQAVTLTIEEIEEGLMAAV